MTSAEEEEPFEYFVTTDEEKTIVDSMNDFHDEFEKLIARIEGEIPWCRERCIALEKLREADQWVGMACCRK